MQDYYKRLLQLPAIGVAILLIGLQIVHAGVLQNIYTTIKGQIVDNVEAKEVKNGNSQTVEALKPVSAEENVPMILAQMDVNDVAMKPGDVDDDHDDDMLDQTLIYEVKGGDTLASVAKFFEVSRDTIRWANNLKTDTLKPGQVLIIPPVTGVLHEVKKGDTVASIAKKYKADIDEIYRYNAINDKTGLALGDTIVVPDGKKEATVVVTKKTNKSNNIKKDGSSKLLERYTTNYEGYYMRPLSGGRKTQGLHGHNGIDFGAPVGTPILASASGVVTVARGSGYNGGYGQMIVIRHPNGTQTVYGHLSYVGVSEGQNVNQGDVIGALGNTGKSTGPHLHFEVRGAVNPF